MTSQQTNRRPRNWRSFVPKDWRINVGLVTTALWFLFLATYISGQVGLTEFMRLSIEEMGTFLEGAFAFVAFLWLVIGLFIQQSVLAENNAELRRNNLHSERQAQAIAATEMNARQETFFKIAESTRRQIGAVAGLLFISSQGTTGDNNYSLDEIRDFWRQFSSGDTDIFSRMFLSMYTDHDEEHMRELYYGTEVRRRHSEHFIVAFDRLLRLAAQCDTQGIIRDSLVYSAHGLLAVRLRGAHPDIAFPPISGTDSQLYLQTAFQSQES